MNQERSGNHLKQQSHSGSGDNVAGDKKVYFNIKTVTVLIVLACGLIVFFIILNRQNNQRKKEKAGQIEMERKNTGQAFATNYLTLEGQLIEFLIDSNKITQPEIREIFGENPYVLSTPVLKMLKTIKSRFSYTVAGDEWDGLATKSKNVSTKETAIKNLGTKTKISLLVVANSYLEDNYMTHEVSPEQLVTQYGFDKKYISEIFDYEMLGKPRSAYYQQYRYAKKKDIQSLLNICNESISCNKLKVYDYVSNNGELPDKFMVIKPVFNGCASSFEMQFSTPLLKLKVSYIKNVSPAPLKLSEVILKINEQNNLRTIHEDTSGSSVRYDTIKTSLTLLPGQSVIIPAYAYFESETPVSLFESAGTVPEETTENFIYGPSMFIESLSMNNFNFHQEVNYAKKDYGFFMDGLPSGNSCPYVYTCSGATGQFIRESYILHGRRSKEKEGMDTIPIARFDGRIQLREIDEETSFIDYVSVLAIDQKGNKRLLMPQHALLATLDKQYLKLVRGDIKTIHFPGFKPNEQMKYFVIASGYYVPDR